MDSVPPVSRDHLILQPLQPLRSSRGSSSNLRASRSPSATRSSEQMSRERTSDSATATSGGTTVITTTVAIATVTTTTTSAAGGGGGALGTPATSTAANSNSSASSSTVAAAQAAVYSGGNTVTGSLSSSGGVAVRGFRSHSPTHRRRSRERQRRTHGSDQGGLLAYSGIVGTGIGGDMTDFGVGLGLGGGGGGGSAGTGSGLEDSRLSGNEDYYASMASDEFDGSKKLHHRRTHERSSSVQAIDRLNTKIQCTKESIRQEQTARDDNVNEYLKLAASADKQQLQRIKAVFEKKNQKSAHSISQLQKKLDNYTKRAKDLQNHQYQTKSQHRQPREVLRDVGQGLRNVGGNIRDGITGFSGSVMSKPREFAHLIKNKFGSADNINQIADAELQAIQAANPDALTVANERLLHQPGAGTSTGSGCGNNMNNNNTGSGTGKFNSDNGSECSSVTSESIPAGSGKSQSGASQYHIVLKSLLTELSERKAETEKLKERIERLETSQKEFNNLTATLEGERFRAEGLEEQINDLTELHQNEIENLKQTIADMEEKVQYQSDERLRDVNEVLENCQTRISKMEHMSQQQYVTVEGIDNSNARALVVKLINVVLTILQVVLLLVATAAGIIMPFLKTRLRVLTTFLTICFIIFVIRQWPDVQDIGAGLVRYLKQSLVVK
ncbi:transmembrane and coiled-coil domains protein 2 isoform X2 [Drosophila hydei]|nr:transmembrane and coiled-coil domains protein 2 isoform X2 [Drosophila hydei]XP_030080817.1 transmembrane and coiled-coil domains protein 2 isoform X2 [Drosophila hydei]